MSMERKAQRLARQLQTPPLEDPDALVSLIAEAALELSRLDRLLHSPAIEDFLESVRLEAGHQAERWGREHDAVKEPEDWFWLVGYLCGKVLAAVRQGEFDKGLHHTISTSAVLSHWHQRIKEDRDRQQV